MTQIKSHIPKIRFKEFSSEWEEKKLGKSFNIFNGYAFKSSDSIDSGVRWVKIADVGIQSMKEDNLSFLPESYLEKYKKFLLKENDYVVALTRPILNGKLKIAKINKNFNNSLLNQRVGKIKGFENEDFIYYLLQKGLIIKEIENNIAGTDPPNLAPNDINNIIYPFPSLPEQQKIASFLSSVDEKIEKIKEKKKNLEEYKKGVMQKIFSQELRFKDENGEEFKDWEEKKLGEIGDFQTSSIDKLSRDGEKEVYLVNYMNVYKHESINNSNKDKLQVVTAKDTQILSNNLKKGDILFTPSSETPDDIGHSIVIFEDLENCVYSYHLMRFRPKIQLNILYSHYFCNIPEILNQLAKLSTGSTRFTISVKSFSSIEVKLPTLKEQEKIADFLSGIDEKIEKVSNELEKMGEFKKGLLQGMFV